MNCVFVFAATFGGTDGGRVDMSAAMPARAVMQCDPD